MLFDHGPSAKPLFKERALWAMVIGLFFFLAYGTANAIAGLTAPHPMVFAPWERHIPFVPELVVPYMSSDLLFVVAFLLAPTRDAIRRLGLRNGLAIMVSAAFFLAMPLQCGFVRPPVEGWTRPLFDLLHLDQPYNQFPSLHISLGFFAWQTIHRAVGPVLRMAAALWFSAVFASTLLVYQHHVIDLVGGVAVTILVCRLLPQAGHSPVPLGFVTPRHLHMALRYLAMAAAATIAAFAMGGAPAIPVGWIALSLMLVAGAYVLGINGFLGKRGRHHPPVIWLMFWPYLAASWINWRWWRSRIRLMGEVAPGLWVGARPGGGDWRRIQAAGVRSVIDLTPELAATTPPDLHHLHLPLLDVAIPAPETLDAIASRIEAARGRGAVYLHCALGMSRSVLAAAAWMIRRGATRQEALAVLDRARPERVRRPYMDITLDIYERHVRSCRRESEA